MAKESAIEKNQRRAKLVKKYAGKRARLKEIIADRTVSDEERFQAVIKLAELPRNGAKTRLRNRCQITGRPRANYRKFGMSRISLRKLASEGMIPGVVKSSW